MRATFRVPVFGHVVKTSVRFKEARGGMSILDYAHENEGATAYRPWRRSAVMNDRISIKGMGDELFFNTRLPGSVPQQKNKKLQDRQTAMCRKDSKQA